MKSLLITDSRDAQIGFRLAGIESRAITDGESLLDVLAATIKDDQIGIVIITEQMAKPYHSEINKMKLMADQTIILTIPDPGDSFQDHIAEYVRQSIGIKY